MIDFELSQGVQNQRQMVHMVAEQMMRPISREFDEREHEKPWDFLNLMWQLSGGRTMTGDGDGASVAPSGFAPASTTSQCERPDSVPAKHETSAATRIGFS